MTVRVGHVCPTCGGQVTLTDAVVAAVVPGAEPVRIITLIDTVQRTYPTATQGQVRNAINRAADAGRLLRANFAHVRR